MRVSCAKLREHVLRAHAKFPRKGYVRHEKGRARRELALNCWCSTLPPRKWITYVSSSPRRIGARGNTIIGREPTSLFTELMVHSNDSLT